MQDNNAWTLYWQNGVLDSCIDMQANTASNSALSDVWNVFADSLNPDDAVLDLATGNGTVPLKLLQRNSNLDITGVDYADISPGQHVQGHELLRKVTFTGNTDISQLPYEPEIFDAVTSQFGMEYADLTKVSDELWRVLAPKGRFQFVLHHSESEIVQPAHNKVEELSWFAEDNGMLEQLNAYLTSTITLDTFEKNGKAFLQQHNGQITREITGQIFAAVNQIIDDKERGCPLMQLQQSANQLTMRVQAELSRLRQLIAAALSEQQAEQLYLGLKNRGAVIKLIRLYQVDEHSRSLIGWQITGQKGQD